MTNPGDIPEKEPRDKEPEGNFQYPSYPSTPHPEDQPGYGRPVYDQYYASQDYEKRTEPSSQWENPQVGTGKVEVMAAVKWGFSTAFRQWNVWIVGALLVLAASVILSTSVAFFFSVGATDQSYQLSLEYQASQILISVAVSVFSIFAYHGALRQIDQGRIGFGDLFRGANFWRGLLTLVLVQVAFAILLTVVVLPLVSPLIGTEMTDLANDADAMDFLGRVIGIVAVIGLASLLISPLATYIVFFVIDRKESVWGAFPAGFLAGLSNYGKLLLFHLLAALAMSVASVITFGLAMIVLMPAYLLMTTVLYRQMAKGQLPTMDGVS